MVSVLRFCWRAGMVLSAAAALTLNGCGSSSSTNPPPKSTIDLTTVGVTVQNDSPRCAWITPRWSTVTTIGWHIFDGSGRPHFVDAGKKSFFGYINVTHTFVNPNVYVSIQAEVQKSGDCNSGNSGIDVRAETRDMSPKEGFEDACAHLKVDGNGNYYVTTPVSDKDCAK